MTVQLENPNVSKDDLLQTMEERIHYLEQIVTGIGYDSKAAKKRRFKSKRVDLTLHGMSRALCVETLDPWKENRVRFFHPILHDPNSRVTQLPFASPVSPFGGFDDSGVNWVPPAGSTIVLFFEHGSRELPFYIGTTWHRTRERGFQIPMREWEIWSGKRGGYLHGPGKDSGNNTQVLPPWNTENYNTLDVDQVEEFLEDPAEQRKATFPHIYGFKTPEKHMVKMVDGDPKCNRRWKRFEMLSGCGNWFIMKDDHLHYGGQWAHPDCNPDPGGAPVALCAKHDDVLPYYTDIIGEPIEKTECGSNCAGPGTLHSSDSITLDRADFSEGDYDAKVKDIYKLGHPSTPGDPPDPPHWAYKEQPGTNPSFKHMNECRPYRGPGTPQNNRCRLPQSGIQMLSLSGHTLCMDDSVEEPRGAPEWNRSTEPFDFGCNDKFLGVMYMKSATGHAFTMCDMEEEPRIRGWKNFMEMRSGNGSFVQLNDETIRGKRDEPENKDDQCEGQCQECPPDYAGPRRGVHIYSTSRHRIRLIDHMNLQCGPCRREGGVAVSKATKGFIQIQSGYGLEMRFNDDFSQEETQSQWIQIFHPQCVDPDTDANCNSCETCDCRGPHIMRFQGRPKGEPGLVFLRAGGHAIRQTYDNDIVIVGDKECNPSDKFTYVSSKFMTVSEDVHFRYSGELHIFFAEKQILLLAGRDCPPPPGQKCKGPCVYPVVVGRCPVVCPLTGIIHWTEKALSERVFASAYHPCQVPCSSDCEEYWEAMARAEGKGCREAPAQPHQEDEPPPEEPMLPTS